MLLHPQNKKAGGKKITGFPHTLKGLEDKNALRSLLKL